MISYIAGTIRVCLYIRTFLYIRMFFVYNYVFCISLCFLYISKFFVYNYVFVCKYVFCISNKYRCMFVEKHACFLDKNAWLYISLYVCR